MGIEPTYPAWKAGVLPLNYTRIKHILFGTLIILTQIGRVVKSFFNFFKQDNEELQTSVFTAPLPMKKLASCHIAKEGSVVDRIVQEILKITLSLFIIFIGFCRVSAPKVPLPMRTSHRVNLLILG